MPRRPLLLTIMILTAVPGCAAEVTVDEIRKLRHEAAARKRRIVFHSDGVSMDPEKRFLESNPCVLPHLPGMGNGNGVRERERGQGTGSGNGVRL